MGRTPKPWYWEARNGWYVTIGGQRHPLAKGHKAEAKAEAHKAFHRLMAGEGKRPSAAHAYTFAEVADLFLDHSIRENKPGTTEQYRIKLQAAIEAFGKVKASELRPSHVSRWLARHEWSAATRRQAITYAKAALNFAVKDGLIAANPLAHVERPTMTRRTKTLAAEERVAIVAGQDEAFVDLITALSETGCRAGEIVRLAATDVDWVGGFAEVHRKGHGEQAMPVYLTDRMMALLKKLADRHPTGPLFRNRDGNPWTVNAIRCRFRRLRASKNLDPRITSHAFRRSFVTDGLERGISIVAMAELAGHADIKTTQGYNQIAQRRKHLREAAEKAAGPDKPEPTS